MTKHPSSSPIRVVVRAHKDPFTPASAEETLAKNLIGENVGNLVFSQSSFRLLSASNSKVRRYRGEPAWWLNQTADAFVIPLANAFRPNFVNTMNQLSSRIEKLKIPVVVLGVGAQAKRDDDETVKQAARRFVAAVLEHSASIGVRGEYTKSYIQSLGFAESNIEVIGCPSMFMRGDELPVRMKTETITTDTPLALTLSPYRKKMGDIANANYERYPNLTYFAQDKSTLRLLLGGEYIGKNSWPNMPISLDHPLIKNHQTVFPLDPKPWIEALSKRDFTFGTRIHGAISSIIAGTPALLIAHDSRTKELAEYHKIPYLTLKEAESRALAEDLYQQVSIEPMIQAHRENYERITRFMGVNDLPVATKADNEVFDERINQIQFPPLVEAP